MTPSNWSGLTPVYPQCFSYQSTLINIDDKGVKRSLFTPESSSKEGALRCLG